MLSNFATRSPLMLLAVISLILVGTSTQNSSMASALEMSPQCTYKLLPIYAGGSSKENVNCFVHDPATNMIIVGGNTTSDDFSPAANDHGFLFALDPVGNWMWGNFFYNLSYALSDISGCQMSSDGSSLTLLGMGNSQPVIMDIKTDTGAINKYVSVENVYTNDTNIPAYTT